jgi:hypothetical protein
MPIHIRPQDARQGRITRHWRYFVAALIVACVGLVLIGAFAL